MNIPNSFKNAIADTFYDKTVSVYSYSVSVDDKGWAGRKKGTLAGTVSCNISFADFSRIQENYGLKDAIDITLTCGPTETLLPVGAIFAYDGVYYSVVISDLRDSHIFVVARKWSSRSTA